MTQNVVVERCHAFADPLIDCESSEVDTVKFGCQTGSM